MLWNNLLYDSCLVKFSSKRAEKTILAMYGRKNNSLQLLQKLNKKTRQFCRKEKDLKHILQNPSHDIHLSKKALAYEAKL